MCITGSTPRRGRRLWWALVGYFRAYPPLVQGEGVGLRGIGAREPTTEKAPWAGRPRIRIYW